SERAQPDLLAKRRVARFGTGRSRVLERQALRQCEVSVSLQRATGPRRASDRVGPRGFGGRGDGRYHDLWPSPARRGVARRLLPALRRRAHPGLRPRAGPAHRPWPLGGDTSARAPHPPGPLCGKSGVCRVFESLKPTRSTAGSRARSSSKRLLERGLRWFVTLTTRLVDGIFKVCG